MEFINHAIKKSQESVYGYADVMLYKGNVVNLSRSSPVSLYDKELVSMDVEGGFDPSISSGFIQTQSTRIKASSVRAKNLAAFTGKQ